MSENITSRVSRVLSGTANMLVSAMENVAPEVVLEQAVREVDKAVDDVRAELGRTIARKHLATQRIAEENRRHEELTGKIGLALAEDREDLARAAVGQVVDIEAQMPVLERTIVEAKASETELEGYVAALAGRRREMQAELKQFRASAAAAGASRSDGGAASDKSVEAAVRSAESAFDRVLEKATGVPGATTAADRESATRLAELDELARGNRIKERLAAFRAGDGQG